MKRLFGTLFVSAAVGVCLAGLPFMPKISAPPPADPVYPPGYSNNLVLCRAAVSHCCSLTNLCDMSQFDRSVMVRYWIGVFRTNGVPSQYLSR